MRGSDIHPGLKWQAWNQRASDHWFRKTEAAGREVRARSVRMVRHYSPETARSSTGTYIWRTGSR